MAKKAKKKVRTKAQRSAAAKASWQLRKLREASEPSRPARLAEAATEAVAMAKAPEADIAVSSTVPAAVQGHVVPIMGGEFLVSIVTETASGNYQMSREELRSFALNALQLVG